MRSITGLTVLQRRFLASADKKHFTNPSQFYSDLEDKAYSALRLLSTLADPHFKGQTSVTLEKAHGIVLPQERYERMLPANQVSEFMRSIINGRDRSNNNIELDVYGAELATVCLDYCIRKLEGQWRAAIVAGKEHQYDVVNNKFQEDLRDILGWSRMILDKVRLAQNALETRNKK